MKIYLSKYWRCGSLFFLCLLLLSIVSTVCFCVWSNDREDYIVVLCSLWVVSVLGGVLICSKRFLTYVIVENNEIQSFSLFSKKLCSITTATPIYYAVFDSPQGMQCARFIALSNEPFEYRATYGVAKVRFIQHYNMAKQIVMPYNEQTISILNLDTWYNVR